MFSDDYKNAMDNIAPDGYIKQKVLKQFKKETPTKKPNKTVSVFKAIAVATCCVLIISMWAINSDKVAEIPIEENSHKSSEVSKVVDTASEAKVKESSKTESSKAPSKESFQNNSSEAHVAKTPYDKVYLAIKKIIDTDNSLISKGSAVAMGGGSSESTPTHSDTINQVEGVQESDIVKTDGKYIYHLSRSQKKIKIIKAGKEAELLSTVEYGKDSNVNAYTGEIYLLDNKIVLLYQVNIEDYPRKAVTRAIVYSVANPKNPKKLYECEQSGEYDESRLIGDKLYLISDYNIMVSEADEAKPETFVPLVTCSNYDSTVAPDNILINENCEYTKYTVIGSYSIKSGKMISTKAILGGIHTLYCSTENIITAGYDRDDITEITRFSINDGKIKVEATGEIKGELLNQFSIDEYKGYFRFVTTESSGSKTSNSLVVLNGKLKKISAIKNLAPDERVYSVNFMGDTAYFVTFREIDPLFSVDLSDPKKPKVMGALKIPGFSNFLFPYGKGKLLGIGKDADENTGATGEVKLSMFDISDPANVTETAKELTGANSSEALYNHKALLLDAEKNLIGFATDYNRYFIYEFKDGAFSLKAKLYMMGNESSVRGLYINSNFYLINDEYLAVYDMDTFELIKSIELE